MRPIKNRVELKGAISSLEYEQAEKRVLVNEQFHALMQNLKPVNLIKGLFNGNHSEHDLKTNLINSTLGMASGFAAKKILLGKTRNPFTKLIGMMIESSVANNVIKNAGGIISIAGVLFKKLLKKKAVSAD